jgi:hypothetical protein
MNVVNGGLPIAQKTVNSHAQPRVQAIINVSRNL